jgi:hypothetical protein
LLIEADCFKPITFDINQGKVSLPSSFSMKRNIKSKKEDNWQKFKLIEKHITNILPFTPRRNLSK